jgi:hypothetical protein
VNIQAGDLEDAQAEDVQTEDVEAEDGQPPKKKRKTYLPKCVQCKATRGKCDHKLPCKKCAYNGLTCEYDAAALKRFTPEQVVDDTLEGEGETNSGPIASSNSSAPGFSPPDNTDNAMEKTKASKSKKVAKPKPQKTADEVASEQFAKTTETINKATGMKKYSWM